MGALAAPIAGGVASGLVGGLFSKGGSKGNSGSYQENTPYVPRPRPEYMPTQQQYMMPSYYSPVSYGLYQAPAQMPQAPVRYVSLNEAAQQYLTQNPDVSEYFNTKLDRNRFRREYGVTTPEDFALWHYTNWGRKENRMFPSYGGMFSGNNQAAPQLTGNPLARALNTMGSRGFLEGMSGLRNDLNING